MVMNAEIQWFIFLWFWRLERVQDHDFDKYVSGEGCLPSLKRPTFCWLDGKVRGEVGKEEREPDRDRDRDRRGTFKNPSAWLIFTVNKADFLIYTASLVQSFPSSVWMELCLHSTFLSFM